MLDPNWKPFLCENCCDFVYGPQWASKEPSYCVHCWEQEKAMRANKCLRCGGPNPIKEWWPVCQQCHEAELEEPIPDYDGEEDWPDEN